MEKSEFTKLAKSDWGFFYEIIVTHNVDVGEDIYHTCKFCDYRTKAVPNLGSDDIDRIDNLVLDHVWAKHCDEAAKRFLDYRSKKIASATGQKKLVA